MRTFKAKLMDFKGWRIVAIASVVLVLFAVVAYIAVASTEIDLSTVGAKYTSPDGVVMFQGMPPEATGTGVFNPYLRVQTNNPIEQGYNSDNPAAFTYDQTPSWTKALNLAEIPRIKVAGETGMYFEFFLDINQVKSQPYLSMDQLKIWTGTTDMLAGYNVASGWPAGTQATPVWDLGDNWVLMNYLAPGSGRGDLSLYVPAAKFGTHANCNYGDPIAGCNTWVYFWTQFGAHTPNADCGDSCINNDGFEEWDTAVRPVIHVAKTATTTWNKDYKWEITKSVAPAEWSLFAGESGSSKYTVGVTKALASETIKVTGQVTIENATPKGGPDAIISSIADVLTLDKAYNPTVDCGVTLPYKMSQGQTLTCTYSYTPAMATNGTNEVTVTLSDGTQGMAQAAVTFTPTETNASINVTDTNDKSWGPVSANTSWTYDKAFDCSKVTYTGGVGSYTWPNTAKITETGQQATASVKVNCYQPSISKTAAGTYNRGYSWEIAKSVDPAEWWLFAGQSGTSKYTVTVTKSFKDSDFVVAGAVTIVNPHPTKSMEITLMDQIGGANVTWTDCTNPVTVPAADSKVCKYTKSVASSAGGTNTAWFTFYDIKYTATEPFTFTQTSEGYSTVNVCDTNDSCKSFSDSGTWEYTKAFDCSKVTYTDGVGSYDWPNTAKITETNQQATAKVKVTCYQPSISKTAATTFTRRYEWKIQKWGDQTQIGLKVGEKFPVNYVVTATMTGHTDSDFAVNGAVTVVNPNPKADMSITLDDQIGGANVKWTDCTNPVTVMKGESKVCHYTFGPQATPPTSPNTAWFTFHGIKYTAGAAFAFTAPTKEVDKCVQVFDSIKGLLGLACTNESPKVFKYTLEVGPFDVCGPHDFPNYAWIWSCDTQKELARASWNVHVTMLCGCTLTQGYWKTHSQYGPAGPFDAAWNLVKPAGADSQFFGNTGVSWYDIMWMPPKQGNAYLILAHQYVAAWLNINKPFKPATAPTAVVKAMDEAKALLTKYTIDNYSERDKFLMAADTLGAFNEGMIGPGHCDE